MKALYGIGLCTLLALLACTGNRPVQPAEPVVSSRENRVRARLFMEDSLPDSAAVYYRKAIAIDSTNQKLLLEFCQALLLGDDGGIRNHEEIERTLDLYLPLAQYPASVVAIRLGYYHAAEDSVGAVRLILQATPHLQAQDSWVSFVADMYEASHGLFAMNACHCAIEKAPRDKALLEATIVLRRAFHADGGEAYRQYMQSLYELDTNVLGPLKELASYESQYYYYEGHADSAQKHWTRYAHLDTSLQGKAEAYRALYNLAAEKEDSLGLERFTHEAMRLEPLVLAHPYSLVEFYRKRRNFPRVQGLLDSALKVGLDSTGMGILYQVKAEALWDERALVPKSDTAAYRRLSRSYVQSMKGKCSYGGPVESYIQRSIDHTYAELGEADPS